jgi:hypothetical protein
MNVASLLSGKIRQLDRKVAADETVPESDVTDAPKLAKLLTRLVRGLSELQRGFSPRRTDFEDIDVPTGDYVRFPHGFGGRVRWWIVDVEGNSPELVRVSPDTLSDANTLVLYSGQATRLTLRVEQAG